jgi:hypothetical protein
VSDPLGLLAVEKEQLAGRRDATGPAADDDERRGEA